MNNFAMKEHLKSGCVNLQREVCKCLMGLDEEVIDKICDTIEERFKHLIKIAEYDPRREIS